MLSTLLATGETEEGVRAAREKQREVLEHSPGHRKLLLLRAIA